MTRTSDKPRQCLQSWEMLNALLLSMTEEEVLAALELEGASTRRPVFISRLIQRAVRLNEIQYSQALRAKYGA